MPKSKKSPKGLGRQPSVVRIPFQYYMNQAMTSGAIQLQVTPQSFTTLNPISDVYELYRFTELQYEILPRGSLNTLSVGYYPDAFVTNPASQITAMANLDAIIIPGVSAQTTPVKHTVPQSRLRGQLPWYKCVGDAAGTDMEVQGLLVYIGSGTEATNSIIRGICEFKNPMDATAALNKMRSAILLEFGITVDSESGIRKLVDNTTANSVSPCDAVEPSAPKVKGPKGLPPFPDIQAVENFISYLRKDSSKP